MASAEASAAIYMAFIHTIDRFPNVAGFRQWTGMTPSADQSGDAQTKGLPITQAGPNLIKATLFLDANVARQWDPQLARIYYNQMVRMGSTIPRPPALSPPISPIAFMPS